MNNVEWPRSTVNHSQYWSDIRRYGVSMAVLSEVCLRGFWTGTVELRTAVRSTYPAAEMTSWMSSRHKYEIKSA